MTLLCYQGSSMDLQETAASQQLYTYLPKSSSRNSLNASIPWNPSFMQYFIIFSLTIILLYVLSETKRAFWDPEEFQFYSGLFQLHSLELMSFIGQISRFFHKENKWRSLEIPESVIVWNTCQGDQEFSRENEYFKVGFPLRISLLK